MTRAYVGLGSNLPPREEWLRQAAMRLRPHLLAVSPVYESLPVGPVRDQPRFLNAVALLSWPATADELLTRLETIERELGRQRTVPKGPRTIDCDLLLFGRETIRTERLHVPHPALLQRAFAAFPILDLDGSVRLPDGRLLRDAVTADRGDLTVWPMRWEVDC